MSDHRARRRPWWRSMKLRAVLSLGIVFGLGATGTLAFWTDTASMSTGSFTSGKMDLQLDAGAVGTDTAYANTSITWAGLSPSERKAFNLSVKNVGNPTFTFVATVTRGTAPPWAFSGTPITVQFFAGAASPDTTYPQQDTCSGSSLGPSVAVDGSNKALLTSSQTILANQTQAVCVVVGLDSAADNANQGKAGSVKIDFSATQATS